MANATPLYPVLDGAVATASTVLTDVALEDAIRAKAAADENLSVREIEYIKLLYGKFRNTIVEAIRAKTLDEVDASFWIQFIADMLEE